MRRAVALPVIAPYARADEVFPCFTAAARFRNNVVNRQRNVPAAAVLAPVTVSAENILARENYPFVRDADVDTETYDTRKRHRRRDRMKEKAVGSCDQFSFPEVEKDDCFLDVANTERLVVVIEDEHFSIQLPVRHYHMRFCTED